MSTNKVAFITGASRGIGKQLAVDFAARGYDVVCVARSTGEKPTKLPGTVDETAELVRRHGRRALALGVDLQVEEQLRDAVDRTYRELGRIDVLLNNAAIAIPGPTLPQPMRKWRLAMEINVNAPLALMMAACPRMTQGDGGHVINVSSEAAVFPEFGRASYTVSKAALESLNQCMAYELKDAKIGVNVVRIDVPIWSEGFAFTLGDMDTSDFEDPVIMSDACLWLIDQPHTYTGQILTITGLRKRGIVRPRTRVGKRAAT
ncbi:MAG TPA: SDR family oxidoreductase [Candidatus Kryptonia bacterium]|nr:SDR family oxidoreductase [Candidatus Kryptonia bacterium]